MNIRVILDASPSYLVLNKPEGVLSVPGKTPENQRSCVSWVREHFPNTTGPITVHRLDMDTSGLLLVALTDDAQRELSAQFEARAVEKSYTAVVEGHVRFESGTLNAPMRPDVSRRPMQIIDRAHGRPAVTSYRVLAYEPDRTRLELIPLTGRTHQLRVHCAWAGPGSLKGPLGDPSGRGHPIIGDPLYGDPTLAPRLLLHATRLVFTDPTTHRRVEAICPPPF